jgi:electron transport complex protein RnfG
MSQPQAAARVWPMYRAMVGVGLLCGLLIVAVFQWTRPVIARNRAEALQRAIFEVLPQASSSATFRRVGERFEATRGAAEDASLVHAAYDDEERLVGVAVEASAMGYQDVIRLLYGYSVAEQAIVGIRVLESRETPGLGDKIETDPGFRANFERLDVSVTEGQDALAHPIELVKPGQKQHPWEVDGITGATISSAAVTHALATSASQWVPAIRRRLDDFRQAERGTR